RRNVVYSTWMEIPILFHARPLSAQRYNALLPDASQGERLRIAAPRWAASPTRVELFHKVSRASILRRASRCWWREGPGGRVFENQSVVPHWLVRCRNGQNCRAQSTRLEQASA